MAEVTIRELRNHGGEVVDRVAQGEQITITRAGKPVAELRPLSRPPLTAETLLTRWHRLPPVNYRVMRIELDELMDPAL
ncbi:MAG: type II toxin-antitoxin system Phd/YefM family antitoxin [Streptosporangiaceae bacterium]